MDGKLIADVIANSKFCQKRVPVKVPLTEGPCKGVQQGISQFRTTSFRAYFLRVSS